MSTPTDDLESRIIERVRMGDSFDLIAEQAPVTPATVSAIIGKHTPWAKGLVVARNNAATIQNAVCRGVPVAMIARDYGVEPAFIYHLTQSKTGSSSEVPPPGLRPKMWLDPTDDLVKEVVHQIARAEGAYDIRSGMFADKTIPSFAVGVLTLTATDRRHSFPIILSDAFFQKRGENTQGTILISVIRTHDDEILIVINEHFYQMDIKDRDEEQWYGPIVAAAFAHEAGHFLLGHLHDKEGHRGRIDTVSESGVLTSHDNARGLLDGGVWLKELMADRVAAHLVGLDATIMMRAYAMVTSDNPGIRLEAMNRINLLFMMAEQPPPMEADGWSFEYTIMTPKERDDFIASIEKLEGTTDHASCDISEPADRSNDRTPPPITTRTGTDSSPFHGT